VIISNFSHISYNEVVSALHLLLDEIKNLKKQQKLKYKN